MKQQAATAIRPWDKLAREKPKPYAAFCVYRDLGPTRSVREAVERFYSAAGKSNSGKLRNAQEWSRLNQWVARAAAYDLYLDEMSRGATEAAIQKQAEAEVKRRVAARERRITIANLQIVKGGQRLNDIDSRRMRFVDALAMTEAGLKNERLELGEAVDRQEHTGPGGAPLPSVVFYLPEKQPLRTAEAVGGNGDDGGNGDEEVATRHAKRFDGD